MCNIQHLSLPQWKKVLERFVLIAGSIEFEQHALDAFFLTLILRRFEWAIVHVGGRFFPRFSFQFSLNGIALVRLVRTGIFPVQRDYVVKARLNGVFISSNVQVWNQL